MLNSKPEIQGALEEIDKFTDKNPNIKIKIVKYSKNQTDYNKITSMYGYGNPPTMLLIDSAYLRNLKNNFLDLSR